jgi:hypothetical protein
MIAARGLGLGLGDLSDGAARQLRHAHRRMENSWRSAVRSKAQGEEGFPAAAGAATVYRLQP